MSRDLDKAAQSGGTMAHLARSGVFDLNYRPAFPQAEKVTLKEEVILDRWSFVMENGQGNAERIYKETQGFLREASPPGVRIQRVRVRPTWLRGLVGVERDYLMATSETLADFRMYVGARDYGNNLDVAWYLTCEPGQFKRVLSNVLTKGESETAVSFDLDLFQHQDLEAYATVVHRCLLKAVERVMTALHQDPTKIDRSSKGFLGIS